MSNNIPPKTLQIPNRDQVTAVQLNSLLSVAGAVSQMLHSAILNETDNHGESNPGKNDGGVKASLETTLIGACSKLDEILADSGRWSMKEQSTLEAELSEVYKAHKKFLDLQADVVQRMEAPHRKFVPQLLKLQDGLWAAILGDPKDLANSIVGIGGSPQDALDNYDKEFLGKNDISKATATNIIEIKLDEDLDPNGKPPIDSTPPRRKNKRGSGSNPPPE